MDNKQNTQNHTSKNKPVGLKPNEVAENPNPRANENIRVRSEEPKKQNPEKTQSIGSEITDGEDA